MMCSNAVLLTRSATKAGSAEDVRDAITLASSSVILWPLGMFDGCQIEIPLPSRTTSPPERLMSARYELPSAESILTGGRINNCAPAANLCGSSDRLFCRRADEEAGAVGAVPL